MYYGKIKFDNSVAFASYLLLPIKDRILDNASEKTQPICYFYF